MNDIVVFLNENAGVLVAVGMLGAFALFTWRSIAYVYDSRKLKEEYDSVKNQYDSEKQIKEQLENELAQLKEIAVFGRWQWYSSLAMTNGLTKTNVTGSAIGSHDASFFRFLAFVAMAIKPRKINADGNPEQLGHVPYRASPGFSPVEAHVSPPFPCRQVVCVRFIVWLTALCLAMLVYYKMD